MLVLTAVILYCYQNMVMPRMSDRPDSKRLIYISVIYAHNGKEDNNLIIKNFVERITTNFALNIFF